eukprot:3866232-Pleurochrysis_carterae.AAC.8
MGIDGMSKRKSCICIWYSVLATLFRENSADACIGFDDTVMYRQCLQGNLFPEVGKFVSTVSSVKKQMKATKARKEQQGKKQLIMLSIDAT